MFETVASPFVCIIKAVSGLRDLFSVHQNDANCDCYQAGDGYAKDARLNCPSSLVVSPDGTLYVADLGNIRIRAIRRNCPSTGMNDQCRLEHT